MLEGMKKISLLILLLNVSTAHASSALEEAVGFFDWLEKHAKDFATCEPFKEDGDYILCDKTRVSASELKKMFSMKSEDLLTHLKNKGLKVELVCGEANAKSTLGSKCVNSSTDKMFAEVSSLHGKYLPETKTVLIRNSASPGSLLHEYVHFQQSENDGKVYGRVYKKSRNEIQAGLVKQMDEKLAVIQELQETGKATEAKLHLQEFMIAADAMRGFAPWQDLIDERGIFLLYLKFGKEFGATAADLALARKNMGFICKNPKLAKLIPQKQCKL